MRNGHDIATRLAADLKLHDPAPDRLHVSDTATALATWMPIADVAAGAQGLIGLAAESLHRARGGPPQQMSVDRRAASLSMTASAYLTVNGEKATSWDPLTGYWPTADGWVYTHCQFPHLRDRLLETFGLPNDRAFFGAALAKMPAQEVEDRAAEAGVCAIMRRNRATWDAHPQAAVLRRQSVVQMDRHETGAGAKALPPADSAPLSGVRVLDLSRVIAGPMMGRTLAEHGADVLRVSAPHLPFFESLVINTGFGKRSAHVDLREADGRAALERLIADADVLIDGYRPGALAGHGFGYVDLCRINPNLVYVTLSALGETGPWGGRRGYDTYVQGATGLSADGPDGPARLPCQPLDYLSGYLGGAAAMIALNRRQKEGGAWRIELALARTAMWLWEMTDQLAPETSAPAANPAIDAVGDFAIEMDSALGHLRALRPVVRMSETQPLFRSAPVPLGTHDPVWAV